MNDLLKVAQAAIDRKPTRDELMAVQDAFAEPATADDFAFGQVVGGIGDPIARAIAAKPSTPVALREWCKNARLAIQVHEAGTSPVLYLLHLAAESGLSPAKRLAAIALQYLSEQGGIIVASDLAASAQAVDELSDVLPILVRIEGFLASETTTPTAVDAKGTKPKWKKSTGELFFGDQIVKQVRVTGAKNVARILSEFEEFDWPPSIKDPLPGGKNSKRLRLAIQSLNANLRHIAFAADGSGCGIIWRLK